MWKINGKEIKYFWVKENWNVPLRKSHRIIFLILCDMGLPCSKLNSNIIKDKKNICSFQKVHKHYLIQNELVSTFTFKKNISNFNIRFLNHLYRNNENNVTYVTLGGTYLFSKVHICDAE